jgi:hypothetical protein
MLLRRPTTVSGAKHFLPFLSMRVVLMTLLLLRRAVQLKKEREEMRTTAGKMMTMPSFHAAVVCVLSREPFPFLFKFPARLLSLSLPSRVPNFSAAAAAQKFSARKQRGVPPPTSLERKVAPNPLLGFPVGIFLLLLPPLLQSSSKSPSRSLQTSSSAAAAAAARSRSHVVRLKQTGKKLGPNQKAAAAAVDAGFFFRVHKCLVNTYKHSVPSFSPGVATLRLLYSKVGNVSISPLWSVRRHRRRENNNIGPSGQIWIKSFKLARALVSPPPPSFAGADRQGRGQK